GLLADSRIAFGGELLGVIRELRAREDRAAEFRRIEALERPIDALVRLDAAAAVNGAPTVGSLWIRRIVRTIRVLILQAIQLIFVEGLVPRPLNQASTRRVVVRRRERKAGAAADSIDRLHQGLPERRFADDVGAIVILKRAGDNLRGAGAVTVRNHHDRDV